MTESMRMGSGGSRIRESEVVFRPSSCTGNRRRRTGGPRRKAICCCSIPHIQVLDISRNNVLASILLHQGWGLAYGRRYHLLALVKQ
nr:PREDICTED: uncharacterized protein LOC103975151 isoform X3 [Musa acuminata subsp. malaccensis]